MNNGEERVDQLEKYYTPIEVSNKWTGYLFWLCAALSLGMPYVDLIPPVWLQHSISILFVVSAVVHTLLSSYAGYFLIPAAEEQRRKQLLSNALEVPLTPDTTQGYYNNELEPSIARIGVCVLENTFFAKHVCHEMAKRERLRVLGYGMIWFVAISMRTTDLSMVLALTQLLFSGEILLRWVKVELLRGRNECIYSNLHTQFLNRTNFDSPPAIASILDAFSSYESAKSAASIKQSSKIFFRLNPHLSEKWECIRKQLRVEQWDAKA